MIGVYYPSRNDAVKVMEMMKYKLTTVLETDIPMYVKLSIIQDISKGVNYLHSLNPPLIHCNLSVDAVLLTASIVAKVCGFSRLMKKSIYEDLKSDYFCSISWKIPVTNEDTDVFSFGLVVYHVITQLSPPTLSRPEEDTDHAEQYQSWFNQISNVSLKQLVVTCLNSNSPPMSEICRRITSLISELYFLYFNMHIMHYTIIIIILNQYSFINCVVFYIYRSAF